ncbi:hypothetical protein [Rhodococcus sp. IEGM 1330]|uniref:hypothetical protein n=1 Tax=Rhodococcus sp. IEGM 1330 TaxID=3082225 RepID=UPI0029532EA1|nr:hypothetical protein [Rhodococcus sp. IEGM 1330]MDV8025188.1 hypothetical protein [Rhodococcus sp. IEGM 1330]
MMPSVSFDPSQATVLAAWLVDSIDVTTVLLMVAALTVVALLRSLPYGIGVVIACTVGAVVSTSLGRELAGSSITSTDLPNGQLVAAAALLGAASMVASTTWRPAVLGLGTVTTVVVALSAVVVESSSITGIVGAVLIASVWWSMCSIVMLYSPDAAAREARNPLDTAALAVQRTTGRSR